MPIKLLKILEMVTAPSRGHNADDSKLRRSVFVLRPDAEEQVLAQGLEQSS
jgi:hypothetical protein